MMLRPDQSIARVLKRGLQFRGRSQRSEYWWWALFVALIDIAASVAETQVDMPYYFGMSVIGLATYALYFIPDLTVGWRRMQDTGRPGWIYAIFVVLAFAVSFMPESWFGFDALLESNVALGNLPVGLFGMGAYLVLFMIMIILLAMPSQRGDNRYGPHPFEDRGVDVFD